ncbi:uncharacterized protein LOC114753748 isoform X2 [Neltuma alba]|uniref:uncharacterized protein LOC114753748 isoform X2 n=1 Tax=Neltuma alba TaxID=207710 RepID=UPI0010A50245|nr:uncharacterized protein LOC114753748 isoform X2 [Prosopis alba]
MNWFTRNLTWTSRKTEASNPQSQSNSKEEDEDQLYGVTEDLINYTKSFTIDTFKNFPLQYEDEATNAENSLTNSARIRNDLSQWQERHATLVLSRVKGGFLRVCGGRTLYLRFFAFCCKTLCALHRQTQPQASFWTMPSIRC